MGALNICRLPMPNLWQDSRWHDRATWHGYPVPSFWNSAHQIEQEQGLAQPCRLAWAPRAAWQWQPLLPSASSPCQIFAVFFFCISPIIFVLVDPALLHGFPGLSSQVFQVKMPNFWHPLHELSAICAVFLITYKTNKTQINNLIYQLFELNL